MEKTYHQLLQEIEALKQQAAAIRKKEVKAVIAQLREAIDSYGLTAADLGLESSESAKRSAEDARQPKYRDNKGNVWSGRGPRPKWLREAIATGSKKEDFAIRS